MKPTRLQIEQYRYRVYRWYALAQRIQRIARRMEKTLMEMERQYCEAMVASRGERMR